MILATNIKTNDTRSTYPGGKGGAGVYQQIINLIPPHNTYIETHLGGGSIMKHKRPAILNIGIDLDPKVIKQWNESPEAITKNNEPAGSTNTSIVDRGKHFIFKNEDVLYFLARYEFTGCEFIYVDPPYLMGTRKGGKIYNFEYNDQDHVNLLTVLKKLNCMVMISGYYSSLYESMLPGWNIHSFEAQTRQGLATEWLWFNYPKPEKLHDYSYLGDTFRERERIRKKKNRWVDRLRNTPTMERDAIFQALCESRDPALL